MWKGRTKMCDKKILIFLVLIKCTFYSEFHVNKVFKDQVTFPYLYAYLAFYFKNKDIKTQCVICPGIVYWNIKTNQKGLF